MIFKQSIHSMMERQAKEVLKTLEPLTPHYRESKQTEIIDEQPKSTVPETDISTFGRLLCISGGVVFATGAAIELLPETTDTASQLTLAGGIGAAAIGAVVIGYEKLSQQ